MAFKIPRLLSANIDITGTNATWTGSDLNGVAYRWDATIAVDTNYILLLVQIRMTEPMLKLAILLLVPIEENV